MSELAAIQLRAPSVKHSQSLRCSVAASSPELPLKMILVIVVSIVLVIAIPILFFYHYDPHYYF